MNYIEDADITTILSYDRHSISKTLVKVYDQAKAGYLIESETRKKQLYNRIVQILEAFSPSTITYDVNNTVSSIRRTQDLIMSLYMHLEILNFKEYYNEHNSGLQLRGLDLASILAHASIASSGTGTLLPTICEIIEHIKDIKIEVQAGKNIEILDSWMVNTKTLPYIVNKDNYEIVIEHLRKSDLWMFEKPIKGDFKYIFESTKYSRYDPTIATILKYLLINPSTIVNVSELVSVLLSHITNNIEVECKTYPKVENEPVMVALAQIEKSICAKYPEFSFMYDVLKISGVQLPVPYDRIKNILRSFND